jgi:hypothetical protein
VARRQLANGGDYAMSASVRILVRIPQHDTLGAQMTNLNSRKFPDESLPFVATSTATPPCACDGVWQRTSCSLTNVARTCIFPNLQLRS